MRTEDDARHRPIPGDLYICHYPDEARDTRLLRFEGPTAVTDLRTGRLNRFCAHSFWAASGLCDAVIAAGGFERWIPAPEVVRGGNP